MQQNNTNIQETKQYGEILLLGPCTCNCYYCLSKEMPEARRENQLNVHFGEWKNFDEFLDICRDYGMDIVYLSSVETDPILYKHYDELVDYIKSQGFKVGIRTNAANINDEDVAKRILECDGSISVSFNSLNHHISEKMSGKQAYYESPKIFNLLNKSKDLKRKIRIAIIASHYNEPVMKYNLAIFAKYYGDCIDYVQIRKIYRYKAETDPEDDEAFEKIRKYLDENAEKTTGFHESDVYNFYGMNVSLWENVFSKSSVKSINYFTNGIISDNNLLVPGFKEQLKDGSEK